MRKVFRRLGAVLAVVGGVATMVVGAAAGSAQAACDKPRLVSISGFRAPEGTPTKRQEFTEFVFEVSTSDCPQQAALRYETVEYTADQADFVATRGELVFPAGDQGGQRVVVLVIPDPKPEPNECFSVRLTVAGGYVEVVNPEAAGIIVDDDRRAGRSITEGFICSE